jgi:hypothetical protein
MTLVSSTHDKQGVRLVIDSIRSFGGPMRDRPIWIFETDPQNAPCADLEERGTRIFPLELPQALGDYLFATKVFACARAEEMAGPEVRSLIWINQDCLIIRPPLMFDLDRDFDAALRPVHIRNVGIPADQSVDQFWKKIYETLGVKDVEITVESFVDKERIRAYYNSHAFAVNPGRRLLRSWSEHFAALVLDQDFQSGPCADKLHKIFLHQAVLSAVIVVSLDPARIRNLPPEYNYPYNLHQEVAPEHRASALNDLVCIAYEERSLDPTAINDVGINEPLKSWLSARHLS